MVLGLNDHLERRLLKDDAVPQATPTTSPKYTRPPPDVVKWNKPLFTTYDIDTKGNFLYLTLGDALHGCKIENCSYLMLPGSNFAASPTGMFYRDELKAGIFEDWTSTVVKVLGGRYKALQVISRTINDDVYYWAARFRDYPAEHQAEIAIRSELGDEYYVASLPEFMKPAATDEFKANKRARQ